MKPVIGITPTPSLDTQPHGAFRRHVLNEAYAAAVAAAGGLPVILPPQPDDLPQILGFVDGLLLTGGADVDPAHYGEAHVHPTTYGIDRERDGFELALVAGAIAADLPVLGICRGIQVLNVALGGSLVQDLASDRPSPVAHRQQEAGIAADEVGHPVELSDYALLREVFAAPTVGVNSFHHQAIRRLASSLVATGWAPDGVVEAVARPGSRFLVGLQWHPELMFRRHPEQLRPFASLVAAATADRLLSR